MENVRIAYLMNVEWNWIKQRPHFIAEGLGKKFKIKIIYQYRYRRSVLQDRKNTSTNLYPVYVIPFIGKYKKIAWINTLLKNIIIKKFIKKYKPDIIYLTYPDQLYTIPKNYQGRVLYDCMDNHIAFQEDKTSKKKLARKETELINRAYKVLVSSRKLSGNLCERYGKDILKKIVLVRNGFDGNIINPKDSYIRTKFFDICYFGTVSSWFNFKFIMRSLDEFKNLRYILYGPADVKIPVHERLVYKGIAEHKRLYENIQNADCLVMPFIVNEIIESVDPVKLYEYINFNKHIICCKYPEVERFEKFVDFYTDYGSFRKAVKTVQNRQSLKYCNEDRINFLKENSWENRVNKIEKIITG